MKNFLTLLTLLALVFTSCSTDNNEDYEAINPADFKVTESSVSGKATPTTCAITELIAGQHHNAGKIYILADDDNLYVTYHADGWEISETHMFIGKRDDIPTNRGGNPRIGRFPYKAYHSAGTNHVVYTIPLDAIDDCFTVAAHAVVTKIGGGEETAWGEGPGIGGRSWAMATDYCVSGCTGSKEDDAPIRIR